MYEGSLRVFREKWLWLTTVVYETNRKASPNPNRKPIRHNQPFSGHQFYYLLRV